VAGSCSRTLSWRFEMEVGSSIRRFIQDDLMYGDASMPIDNDTPLCEGIIDSIALMELVAFLEETFQIQIDDADLTADNFRTVGAIEHLVNRRAGA
jgi:acyl carrier protein